MNQWTGPSPLEPRLWPQVDASGDCWLWLGHTSTAGYGRIHVNGRQDYVHRIVYELLVGPIPEGLHIDHLCRVRTCVNPDHLQPVRPRENAIRGFAPAVITYRTDRCRRGHRLTPENTYVVKTTGHRRCRACVNARRRARYHA